jgi:hypothetical protein
MDPVLIILSEMISYEGSSVRRCMRRLTTPDGAGGGGALAQGIHPTFSQTQWSPMHEMTLGGVLRCEAFDPRPQ